MDFQLSPEQQDVVDAVTTALSRESTTDRVRAAEKTGFDPGLWHVLARMGAFGVADDHGAVGLVLTAERVGGHLASVPFAEAAVAALLLADPGLAPGGPGPAGDRPVVFSPRPARGGGVPIVAGGAVADGLVVLDGDDLVLVRGGCSGAVDDLGFSAAARWRLDDGVTERVVLASGDTARALFRRGVAWWRLVTAALCVGIGERALGIAVAYAKVREQFGVPIGAFQAIQHTLAEVAVEVDGARLLTRSAAWHHDDGDGDLHTRATAALAYAGEVAVRGAEAGLHVHGGYGYTLEFDPQLYLRRAKALRLYGGDPERLWEAVGTAALAEVP